jgi:hydrogenase maturation protease
MGNRVRLIVCGEPWRGDDAAPRHAARLLPERVLRRADMRLVGQLEAEQLLDVERDHPCVVVDTVVGVPPAQIVVRPLTELSGHAGPGMRSSHALPAVETIALAEALGADLRGSLLVGLGGADFTFGAPLSPVVLENLPRFARMIGRTVLELAARQPAAGSDASASDAVLVPSPRASQPRKESQP